MFRYLPCLYKNLSLPFTFVKTLSVISSVFFYFSVSNALDIYYTKYDKFLLVGDFNAEDAEPVFALFFLINTMQRIMSGKKHVLKVLIIQVVLIFLLQIVIGVFKILQCSQQDSQIFIRWLLLF